MADPGFITFQQTFAKCPFPEGVLAVLGGYPVQVRVVRELRTMEVTAFGAPVDAEILHQAEDGLKDGFRLQKAVVMVAPEESTGGVS